MSFGLSKSLFLFERTTEDLIPNNLSNLLSDVMNDTEIFFYERIKGRISEREIRITPKTRRSAYASCDYGGEFIFERIWINPILIEAGFITEDTSVDSIFWNAFRYKEARITLIEEEDYEGTDIDGITLPYSTPVILLPQFGEYTFTFNIYKSGKAIQNSFYYFTIEDEIYTIRITGLRLLFFDLDPNWDSEVEIAYTFKSVIFTSRALNEQRRSLHDESRISISATYDMSKDVSRNYHNFLSYGKDKIWAVPIYSEKVLCKVVDIGAMELTTNQSESLNYYYNMNHGNGYISIINHEEGIIEVKQFGVQGENLISLNEPIILDYQSKPAWIYPIIAATIKSIEINQITDDFDELKIDFEEYKSGD